MTTYNLKNYFEQPKGLDTDNKAHLEGTSVYNNNEYTAAEIDTVLNGGASQHYVTIDSAQTITGDKTWNGNNIYNGNTYTTEEVDASLSLYKIDIMSTSFSGPWPTTALADCKLLKVGKRVTLSLPSQIHSADTAAEIVMTSPLLTEYRPQQTVDYVQRVISNSSGVIGYCRITASGFVYIYASLIDGEFAATGNAGFKDTNISWVIA